MAEASEYKGAHGVVRREPRRVGSPKHLSCFPPRSPFFWWTQKPISLHTPSGQPEPANMHTQGAVDRVPPGFFSRTPPGGKKVSRS